MFKRLHSWLASRQSQRLILERGYVVTVDDEWITCKTPEGMVTSLAWRDVQAVVIETNDLGPFAPDVFWVIVSAQAKCVIPQGATGEEALIHKLDNVSAKYVAQRRGFMWDGLAPCVSVWEENGWRVVDEFIAGKSFIVFCELADDQGMVEFEAGCKLVPVLEECHYLEFYVTNRATTYLLCFNHHDFLIGAGEAEGWLEETCRRRGLSCCRG